MFTPSSFASSHSKRTTSSLQKFVPRVASAMVISAESSDRRSTHPPRLVAVDPLHRPAVVGPEPPVLDGGVREAEGKHGADAGVLQPAQRFIAVIRRVHDVGPVHERGDAGVQAFQGAPQVAGIDVIGPVLGRELVQDRPEVRAQRVVRRGRADGRLPGVPMGVDEAGNDDVPIGVDHLRAIGRQVRPDLRDRVALDQDVGARQLAERIVLGQHGGPADEDSVAHDVDPFLQCACGRIGQTGNSANSQRATPSPAMARSCSATRAVSRSAPSAAIVSSTRSRLPRVWGIGT